MHNGLILAIKQPRETVLKKLKDSKSLVFLSISFSNKWIIAKYVFCLMQIFNKIPKILRAEASKNFNAQSQYLECLVLLVGRTNSSFNSFNSLLFPESVNPISPLTSD